MDHEKSMKNQWGLAVWGFWLFQFDYIQYCCAQQINYLLQMKKIK